MVEGKKEVRITGAYTLLLYSTASSQRECGMGECGGKRERESGRGKGRIEREKIEWGRGYRRNCTGRKRQK